MESINVEEAFMRITRDLIGSKYVLFTLAEFSRCDTFQYLRFAFPFHCHFRGGDAASSSSPSMDSGRQVAKRLSAAMPTDEKKTSRGWC